MRAPPLPPNCEWLKRIPVSITYAFTPAPVRVYVKLPLNGSEVVLVVDPVGCYLGEPSALSSTSMSALRARDRRNLTS